MSSSTERSPEFVEGRESRVDSKVAKALEAAKDSFLRKIGERVDSPSQIPKVGEILKFTDQEEENTKALVWLKKNEPTQYESVLKASEVNTEKRRRKMKAGYGIGHYTEKIVRLLGKTIDFDAVDTPASGGRYYKSINLYEAAYRTTGTHAHICCLELQDEDEIPTNSSEWPALTLHLLKGAYLKQAQKFARVYEKKTGQEVKICRQY